MESIRIVLDDREFDKFVHGGLSEAGDLTIAAKEKATEGGQPAVVITFGVSLDGAPERAQAVTTLRAFLSAAVVLRGYAQRIGMVDIP